MTQAVQSISSLMESINNVTFSFSCDFKSTRSKCWPGPRPGAPSPWLRSDGRAGFLGPGLQIPLKIHPSFALFV